MKRRLLVYLLILNCLFACTVNRYYYVAEEEIDLYEFPSFSGEPVLTAIPGDTVSATGNKYIQLGGKVPVEYAGYSFYSPAAKAKFLHVKKVRRKRDAMVHGITYAARKQYRKQIAFSTNELIEVDDTREWYGQVTTIAGVLKEPFALSKTIGVLPQNTIVKIKRHDYNYWEVIVDGVAGYVGAFYILDYSRSESPFVKTAYTGPTYHPNEISSSGRYRSYSGSSFNYSNYGHTPSTGATIHIGPKGGQFYINSKGNKTYLKKGSPYRIGGSSSSSSNKYKSSSSGSSYRRSGSPSRSYSTGRKRR